MKRGNFFKVQNQIFDFALSPVCFMVYCYLCKCRNKKNGCYPSKRIMANYSGGRQGNNSYLLTKTSLRGLALERITESRYQTMAPRYEAEHDELRSKKTGLSQAIEQAEETYSRIEEFVPIISKYTDIAELNTYILNELIERIVVHEKTVDEDGSKHQRVDIYYKFVGYIVQ